jgi:hypothetical protein
MLDFQQMPFLADIPALRFSQHHTRAGRFVNMAAEKVRGLMLLDEISNSGAAKVLIGSSVIERSIFGRAVANEN